MIPGVDFRRVAVNAVVVCNGRILLVEFDDESGPHYNLPGGGLEMGESLDKGLRREVLEETCLEVDVGRLLLIVESVGSLHGNLIDGVRRPWNELRFFFLCTPVVGSEARQPDLPDNDHQTGLRWADIDDLPDLPLHPQVGRRLIAALGMPEVPPLIVPNPHLDFPPAAT
jgi:8-oxo-dGTP diphosphatase